MFSLLIADDHALIRQGLRKMLDAEKDLHVAGEAANAGGVLDFLSRTAVDLVLLDINMPGRSGIEVLQELHKRFPKVKVLILSMLPEESAALRTMRAGASGYVSKGAAPDEVVKAIRKVLAGGRYISQTLSNHIAEDIGKPQQSAPHESLSEREMEVLSLFGSGKTVSEIADHLSLSVSTITTYRARILEKLGLRTTAELIHYAIRHNLAEPLE